MKPKKEQKTEVKQGFILLIFSIISITLFTMVVLGIIKLGAKFFLILFAYFFLVQGVSYCYSKRPSGFLKIINWIFSCPLLLFYLTRPMVRLIANLFYYSCLSFVLPTFLIVILNKLTILVLSPNTNLFLLLTGGSIISITFYKRIIKIVYRLMPFTEKISGNFEVYNAPTEYILKTNNIRFIIYASYFIYLFVYSVRLIEEKTVFSSFSLDNAIMQAFVVFLAYDSLICNSKYIKIKASRLLKSLIKTILVSYSVEDKNTDK